jgi:branched-chain amino acid aminotransferase
LGATAASIQILPATYRRVTEPSFSQIKYSELPNFTEVMAAGTAAALVPIRSITRKMDASSPQSLGRSASQHPRLSLRDGEETVTYIPEHQEDSGPVCLRLLTQLKGIQLGKIKDDFGWCFTVGEADGRKVVGETGSVQNGGNGHTVDQLD